MDKFAFAIQPTTGQLASCSTVLNGVAARYNVGRHRTTLTIKSVHRGAARYRTSAGQYLVTPDTFLVLNAGQEYSLDFEGPGVTETVCPFFQAGFVEHAANSLRKRPERQLDDIDSEASSISFPEQLYAKQARIAALLLGVRRSLRRGTLDEVGLEDRFYLLAEAIVRLRQRVDDEVGSMPAVRAATRHELYRRLHRGRDYLASCYHEPLTVESVARVAHLSPYHFHRMFRAAFGQTPMQYLQARRLSAAVRLLTDTNEPVTSICLAVGFESLGSFSWLFSKRIGQSPREFRGRRQNSGG